VFEAIAHTPAFLAHGVTPSQMAAATAQECFEQADKSGSHDLTFQEFKQWFELDHPPSGGNGEGEDPEYAPLPAQVSAAIPPSFAPGAGADASFASYASSTTQQAASYQAPPKKTPLKPFSVFSPTPTNASGHSAPSLSSSSSPAVPQERVVAEAVAEARLKMWALLKDEVATLTLAHEQEVSQLRAALAAQQQEHAEAAQHMQRDLELAAADADHANAQEKQRLQSLVEATGRRAAERDKEHQRAAAQQAETAAKQQEAAVRAAHAQVRAEAAAEVQGLQQRLAAAEARCSAVGAAHSALHDQMVELKGNIRVVCRLRPQATGRGTSSVALTRNSAYEVHLTNKSSAATFAFDQVLGPRATQEHAFAAVAPLVKSALDGRNVCLLAYGQTGSGKTHTLLGDIPAGKFNGELPEGAGVLPRTVTALFEQKANSSSNVAVYLSILEVYNEAVRDLLVDPDPSKGPPKVDLRVTSAGGVTVPNAMELEVPDAATTLEILAIAQENRATAATDVNTHSSRSHLVVTLRLQTTTPDEESGVAVTTQSKLQVVDLAGCERVKASHVAGAQLVEATAINKSLSALGDVVGALVGKATTAASQGLNTPSSTPAPANSFIPYRNSKLTLLLQDALQPHGKAKVVLFVTAAVELNHWNESLAALTFASRCRAVDLYSGNNGSSGSSAAASHKAAAGAAANAAELAAAEKKIAELSAQLRRLNA